MDIWCALGVLVLVSLVVSLGVLLLMPAIGEAVGRARIEREAQEASWRIHQQATRAFGRMLDAAREESDRGRRGRRS